MSRRAAGSHSAIRVTAPRRFAQTDMTKNLDELLARFQPPRWHIADALRYWADTLPQETAFVFSDGEATETVWTFAELDRRARLVAGMLLDAGLAGERVLLLYPPGLEFLAALFGCFFAGAVAVPVFPPRRNRNMTRLEAVAASAQPRAALTDSATRERDGGLLDSAPGLRSLAWLATDEPAARRDALAPDQLPPRTPESLALLQYTSGSTGQPKGVMLRHAHLMHNVRLITSRFELTRTGIGLSWLPVYHDMGLIGGVLVPLFFGRPSVLMSPATFLQRPIRWLRGIGQHRVTISGGPNFAYDLCTKKITDDELAGLDLSTWEVAFNGAEPIRPETLEAFARRFAPCGFRPEAFYPCYGLAENTLMVSGGRKPDRPTIVAFPRTALSAGVNSDAPKRGAASVALVGCGRAAEDSECLIVDPESRQPVADGQVGEVWVRGGSVGEGYWNDAESTEATFGARLADGRGPFLRTGDFGLLRGGELFITGRLKDLIIVRGVNCYPQDLERTAESAHELVLPASSAAFALSDADEHPAPRERLALVCEVQRLRHADWEPVLTAIRRAVAAEHDLAPDLVVLVRLGSVLKTSSGKVQRRACRAALENGELEEVARWEAERRVSDAQPEVAPSQSPPDDVLQVVLERVRAVARERATNLSLDTNLIADLGLDSLERLEVAYSLERTFGGRLPEHVLQRIETVRDISLAIDEHRGPRARRASEGRSVEPREPAVRPQPAIEFRFSDLPEYARLRDSLGTLPEHGLPNPYFAPQDGVATDRTSIGGRSLLSFSTYNYLGMSGEPAVAEAAKRAIDRFGTSVSASRLVAGEKTLHRELERGLAEFLGTDDALVFVGGHATNESVIGHLLGPRDLIVHDALAHNSIVQGALLSGAVRRPFPHNDWRSLDKLLRESRGEFRRVLIAIEGVYSMDGDVPDLPRFIELKQRHRTFLLIDEAHSIGTLGRTGRGVGEHFGVARADVDLWMGTLSKSFGSCGGYVAGGREAIEYLKYTTPGFVFSVGISPPNAAAALAALGLLREQPERVQRLQTNARLFHALCREAGLDTGLSQGTPVVPILIGSSLRALHIARRLFERGVNVHPIVYPAVPEGAARLRFFITSCHSEEQLRETAKLLTECLRGPDVAMPGSVSGTCLTEAFRQASERMQPKS